jgi:hypothetical protein
MLAKFRLNKYFYHFVLAKFSQNFGEKIISFALSFFHSVSAKYFVTVKTLTALFQRVSVARYAEAYANVSRRRGVIRILFLVWITIWDPLNAGRVKYI